MKVIEERRGRDGREDGRDAIEFYFISIFFSSFFSSYCFIFFHMHSNTMHQGLDKGVEAYLMLALKFSDIILNYITRKFVV